MLRKLRMYPRSTYPSLVPSATATGRCPGQEDQPISPYHSHTAFARLYPSYDESFKNMAARGSQKICCWIFENPAAEAATMPSQSLLPPSVYNPGG